MNRFKFAFVIIFLSNPVFANEVPLLPDVITQDSKIFYCPESITCNKSDKGFTCTGVNEHPELWSFQHITSMDGLSEGTFKLKGVIASFHSSSTTPVSCNYDKPKGRYPITLNSFSERNLEVFYLEPTNWHFSQGVEIQGSCLPGVNAVKDCPLKEQPALNIFDVNINPQINALISSNLITKATIYQYTKVILDNAFTYCSKADCRIDFASPEGLLYGYVIVDINNQMKIERIVSSRTDFAEIRQHGNGNSVEIRFTNLGLE